MAPFQYVPRDASKWDRRANQSGSNYANVIKDEFNTFGAHDGENAIRICPPTWENPEHYGYDVWVHFGVGPEGGTVICLSRMKHQPCPICEKQAVYEAQGREDSKELKPKRRVAVWLIDRKAAKLEDNPAIWTMGWTVDREISKVCKDRETGELYMIDHPGAGFDVYFDKTGKGDQTNYIGYSIGKRPNSIEQKHLDFIIANPIPSTLIWRDYKEVKDLFEGEAPPKTEEGQPVQSVPQPTNGAATMAPPVAIHNPGLNQTPTPAPVQTAPPPAPPAPVVVTPPPAPPKQYVSEWVMDQNQQPIKCGTCGSPLYTISPTEVTCEQSHRISLAQLTAAPQPVAAPPSSDIAGRANAMKSRFQTGK